MFEKAIAYPTRGDGGRRTLAIGIVLSLLTFLLVPAFLVFGYLVRVLRQGSDEIAAAPACDEWVVSSSMV